MSRGPRRYQAVAAVLVATVIAGITIRFSAPPVRAHAHDNPGPVQVGTSFSPVRAERLSLDWKASYSRLLTMNFKVIRLGIYWDQVAESGYSDTDWLVEQSRQAGQPIVLTVGIKSLGWPEYFAPQGLGPFARPGSDVSGDAVLRAAALAFIEETVTRYRDVPALVAWQIENEPLNRAGPQRWWIGDAFVRQELEVARSAAAGRPLLLNAFTHFNRGMDMASSSRGFDLGALLGFDGNSVEKRSLGLLQAGDILGLDVYTRIAYRSGDRVQVSPADSDWDDNVARWAGAAQKQGKGAWVTEAQAEPWEADPSTLDNPLSLGPADIAATFGALKQAGAGTVLLWGSEYWLLRSQQGDQRWLDAVAAILAQEARAPSLI